MISSLFLDVFKFKKISIEELRTARIDIEKAVLVYVIRNVEDAEFEAHGQIP